MLLEAVDTANVSCAEEVVANTECRQVLNAVGTVGAFCSMAVIVKAVYLPHDRHHVKGVSQHFCMLIVLLMGLLQDAPQPI